MEKLKRILAAALIAAIAVSTTACHQITQGEVYDKQFIPAHHETYTTSDSVWINGELYSFPTTKTSYYPDEYRIYICKENDKGDFDKTYYTVGKEKYDSVKIGDEISFE